MSEVWKYFRISCYGFEENLFFIFFTKIFRIFFEKEFIWKTKNSIIYWEERDGRERRETRSLGFCFSLFLSKWIFFSSDVLIVYEIIGYQISIFRYDFQCTVNPALTSDTYFFRQMYVILVYETFVSIIALNIRFNIDLKGIENEIWILKSNTKTYESNHWLIGKNVNIFSLYHFL